MNDKLPQATITELQTKLDLKENISDFAFDLLKNVDQNQIHTSINIRPSNLKGYVTTCKIDPGTGQCNPTDTLIPDPNGQLLAMIILSSNPIKP